MTNYAVITAGGRGTRMKSDINKSFLPLAGMPVIAHTLTAFERTPAIDQIVIVIGADSRAELEQLLETTSFAKVAALAEGGKERQDSVRNGVRAIQALGAKPDDIVAVHSSVNPFIEPAVIEQCVRAAQEHGASAAAAPVKDTIHAANEQTHLVEEILHRPRLWAAQTPQCAKLQLLVEGFERAAREGWTVTDEVQLVKKIGGQVKLINCGYNNIKITTPEDLQLAERILTSKT